MKHFQLHVSVTGVCDQRIEANRGAYGSRKIPANEKTEGFHQGTFAGNAIKRSAKGVRNSPTPFQPDAAIRAQ
jgi:hypothetical protein